MVFKIEKIFLESFCSIIRHFKMFSLTKFHEFPPSFQRMVKVELCFCDVLILYPLNEGFLEALEQAGETVDVIISAPRGVNYQVGQDMQEVSSSKKRMSLFRRHRR